MIMIGKRLYAMMAALAIAMVAMAQDVPAFPGAEGHGRYVTGGRGGEVRHVTRLDDTGSTSTVGTLRWAVNGSAKKIVVFDVGGVIALTKDLTIGANTTIEGQTAPAPGITVRYYTVQPSSNNIIRFIRFRRGQEKSVDDGADAMWQRHVTGLILDHCSLSWSIDEVASFYDNNNFTMQWCTIAESLVNAGHGKGAHGYGGIWGGKLASFHHNLIAHVANRSPRFNGARYNWTGYTANMLYSEYQWKNAVQAENVDFRNCVVYNCGNGCYGGPGGGQINMVNNAFKTGPAGTTNRVTTVTVGASGNASGYPIYWDMTSRYYITGNNFYNQNGTLNTNYSNNNWSRMSYDSGTYTDTNGDHWSKDPNHYYGSDVTYQNIDGTDYVRIRMDEPTLTGEVTTHTADVAFDRVLSYAGASLIRDDVDTRYETEARGGTATYKNGRIDLVSDVNGYTEENFGTGSRASGFDTDGDGIPDAWETANGLNPNSADDAALYTIDPVAYYTNLEVYLNSLVQDIMIAGNNGGDDAVKDYFPAYKKEDGTQVAAVNAPDETVSQTVTFKLAQSTNTGTNTSAAYNFNDGVTITNTKSKNYATGKDDGIKYSAGVHYTINLPAGISINKITFTGYNNYDDDDAYLGEVAGTEYSATDYVFPKTKATTTHTISFTTPVTGSITFTPSVKQCVFVITLTGSKGTTAIELPAATDAAVMATEYYDLQGRRLLAPQQGVTIRVERLTNGKKIVTKIMK